MSNDNEDKKDDDVKRDPWYEKADTLSSWIPPDKRIMRKRVDEELEAALTKAEQPEILRLAKSKTPGSLREDQ